jgi:glycosyltransferase involved in cell wall biosynthesis
MVATLPHRKILVLTRYGELGASSRVRFLQFLTALDKCGMSFSVQPFFDNEYVAELYKGERTRRGRVVAAYLRRFRALALKRRFDLIWLEKEALPWMPAGIELAAMRGTPYVVDIDDAWFHRYDRNLSAAVRRLMSRKIDIVMQHATAVVAGNQYLAERARHAQAQRIEVIPSVVDFDRYAALAADQSKRKCKTTTVIGWIGTPITVRYLSAIEDALRAVSAVRSIELLVVGASMPPAFAGLPVRSVPWSAETETEKIGSFDIGIMPLDNTEWEQGKCAYKLLQVMAAGRPVVASPIGANCDVIRDGSNGFLAEGTNKWIEVLITLIDHPNVREKMGREAIQTVKERYTIESVLPRLSAVLLEASVLREQVCPRPAPLV